MMNCESNNSRSARKRSFAELAELLRRDVPQEFSVFDVVHGRLLHAGEMLGEDTWHTVFKPKATFDSQVRVISCGSPFVCLAIPLGVAGYPDAVAVGVFRTRELLPGDRLDTTADRLATDSRTFADWVQQQPVFPSDALVCLGRVFQGQLAADLRVSQLEFQTERLAEKIGDSYEEISLLYQIVDNVRNVAVPEELARFVLDWAISVLPAEQAIVQIFESGATEATENATFLSLGQEHLDSESFGRLIEFTEPNVEGRPLVLNAESTQVCEWPFPDVRELIVVPLRADQYNAGWLAVINHAEGGWLGTLQARLMGAAATVMGMRVMMNDLGELRTVAESANSIKSRILDNLGHELRTPLNGILAFSRLLLDGACAGEPERREALETIEQCTGRLGQIVDDLSEIHDLETGRIQVQRIECRLDEIIRGVVTKLERRAEGRGLTLEATGVAGTLALIFGDPQQLSQLLTILVANSIKFTERGTVRVETKLIRSGDVPRLKIMVHDTGVGIPPDKLEEIFDPFVKSDSSGPRSYGGLGLGLAICRRLAESFGATLTAANRPGGGSTLTLELGQESFSVLVTGPDEVPDEEVTLLVAGEPN